MGIAKRMKAAGIRDAEPPRRLPAPAEAPPPPPDVKVPKAMEGTEQTGDEFSKNLMQAMSVSLDMPGRLIALDKLLGVRGALPEAFRPQVDRAKALVIEDLEKAGPTTVGGMTYSVANGKIRRALPG